MLLKGVKRVVYLLIIRPVMRPPIVFPTTAGTRYEPASALEAPDVTWKYKGIENIIDICAAICKARIAYELATFRSKSNRGGKMGSLAYFCSKTTKKTPRMTLEVRSEITTGEAQEIPRLGISMANMNVTMVVLISIEPT
jgi:hypothetical protein